MNILFGYIHIRVADVSRNEFYTTIYLASSNSDKSTAYSGTIDITIYGAIQNFIRSSGIE